MVNDPHAHYTVLARRFRPQSFDDVVGQEHVGQAIRNAIRGGRVAHAYLFTGARGVGKTSTARIFAKALNCPNVKDGVPCNHCDVCERIGAGNDVDVLEIDGASNRGIDDIRQLRANVNVRSMRSPNKVYIIDEVHMLTKEAFNALLKTLEEPPANVKFVFCTTEPNKVPDTILSRCQRFDFGTISQSSIAGRLKQIAAAEGKQVADDAVELIARRAAGSMRDSQSLFDQLLAFGGELITSADVHQLLGTAADDRLIELVDALIAGGAAEAVAQVEQALSQGVQLGSFSDQLLAYLRDLLITAAGATDVPLSAVSDTSREAVQRQAKQWGLQNISAAMQILAETKGKMHWVNYGRALVELAIVRMATLEDLASIAALAQGLAGQPPGTGAARLPTPSVGMPLKKNFESPPESLTGRQTASPTHPATQSTEPVSSPPAQTMALHTDTVKQILERMLAAVPDKLAEQLRNGTCATSGPNLLEIVFPKSYLFSKNYCERPETLSRLKSVAGEIVGREIGIRIRLDEAAAGPPPTALPRSERPPVERRRTSVVDNDTFVQNAVGVFGGQVVAVRPLLLVPVSQDPETESDESAEMINED